MQCKRILFATDFSAASQTALQYATALARDSNATLLIVHVEDFPVSYPGGEMVFIHPESPNPVLQRMLDEVVPADGGVRYERHLLMGVAADEIVRFAGEKQVDLIVIGTHGRTGLSRVLVGSVAELVIRRAKCPVLSVKAAPAEPTTSESSDAVSSAKL
jgi:universal stress protein A